MIYQVNEIELKAGWVKKGWPCTIIPGLVRLPVNYIFLTYPDILSAWTEATTLRMRASGARTAWTCSMDLLISHLPTSPLSRPNIRKIWNWLKISQWNLKKSPSGQWDAVVLAAVTALCTFSVVRTTTILSSLAAKTSTPLRFSIWTSNWSRKMSKRKWLVWPCSINSTLSKKVILYAKKNSWTRNQPPLEILPPKQDKKLY